MSNLSDFLSENSITAEQVAERSKILETLDSKGRDAAVKRSDARRQKKSYDEADAPKPAGLGRGASLRTVKEALEGKPIPRAGRKKITRAVNSLLVSQGKSEVEFRALFADVGARKGKSK